MASEAEKDHARDPLPDNDPIPAPASQECNQPAVNGDRPSSMEQNGKVASNGAPQAPQAMPKDTTATTKSREASPLRAQPRSKLPTAAGKSRSRKNSQELSPTRFAGLSGNFASVPSAAAVQRALSANKPPTLASTVDGANEGARPDRGIRSGDSSAQWPISPRLRSPPPSNSVNKTSIPSLRKSEGDGTLPNTSLKRFTASSSDISSLPQQTDTDKDDTSLRPGTRTPARGASANAPALETVAEGSMPTTPAIGPHLNAFDLQGKEDGSTNNPDLVSSAPNDQGQAKADSTSDSTAVAAKPGAEKPDQASTLNTAAPVRPATNLAKRSLTNLSASKHRPAALDSMRSMTVETEQVTSVPQVGLGPNSERGTSGRMNSSGSVRQKPSHEAIRPKKGKKKTARKPPSIHSGTVSSKADNFEAKVASAIDETNSSDSDETFVYESNPAERNGRNAHHSRTPSATSVASQADGYSARKSREASQGVAAKKSMKFTNNAYNNNLDDVGTGSGRGSTRNGGSTPRHHHIGRYGRGGHTGLFDTDSPFTQANKASSPRTSVGNAARMSPRPNSPRIASASKFPGSPKKGDSHAYIDDGIADDERTPLVGSVRVNRSRHARRPVSARQGDYFGPKESSCCSRYGACIIVTVLLLVLCIGAGTFVMALNRPLTGVSVKQIQNVLASEQEIMLDLDVRATNPNIFAITVSDLDVNVFAKSGYVGSSSWWRERGKQTSWTARREYLRKRGDDFHTTKGVDEGTDPIEDPEEDAQTMLLGRIFDFDSPLVFQASPMQQRPTSSVGQIRLAKPGNQTEEGGSARWERVLQHPFELIVRGVIKYQLPISSKMTSAALQGRIKVMPKDEADTNDTTTRDLWIGG